MIPSTLDRVPANTSRQVNERIRLETENNVARTAARGTPAINQRLAELAQEWDIERALEMNAATASLVGLTLGATVSRKWYALPAVVAGFLLQHAVQGWCPPVPVMRRLGFRTQVEIDRERYALKAMRGDFRELPASSESEIAVGPVLKALDD